MSYLKQNLFSFVINKSASGRKMSKECVTIITRDKAAATKALKMVDAEKAKKPRECTLLQTT